MLIRLQAANGTWRWIHCVLQVKDAADTNTTNTTSSQQTQQQSQQQQQTTTGNNIQGSTINSSQTATTTQQQQPVIVATNQVLGEKEASVLRANSWLYHYYTMQSKLQYGITYEAQRVHAYYPSAVMSYQVWKVQINFPF